ncbi:MAG: hypothetical protein ACJZ77_03815, partial [Pseudohongiellaceae bacterium]
ASWRETFNGNRKLYDIDDKSDLRNDSYFSVFAEYITGQGTSWRFDARDITNSVSCRERTRFIGRLSNDVIEEIENRCRFDGIVVSLKITGTF